MAILDLSDPPDPLDRKDLRASRDLPVPRETVASPDLKALADLKVS